MGKGGIVDTKKLFQRHLEVCQEIFKISQRLEVGLFDTTRYLRDSSSKGYIHRPKDWDHLNESGYRALSDGISQFILHPDEPYPNCVHISQATSFKRVLQIEIFLSNMLHRILLES